MVMPSKVLIYDHSKILEFGNAFQLIIVSYKGYINTNGMNITESDP